MSRSVLQELLPCLAFTLGLTILASCQAVIGIDDVSRRPGDGGDLPDGDVPDAEDSRRCPAVFTQEYGGHRYFISSNQMLYDQAVAECFAMGGHLAVIDDADENQVITGLITGPSWIGYDDLIVEGRHDPVTGALPEYFNWDENQPDDWSDGEDCIAMRGGTGKWNDFFCTDQFPYVCECDLAVEIRQVPACMSNDAYDRILKGRRYRWAETSATWQAARDICLAEGADLVVISDQHEQDRIAATITNSIWLGLKDPEEDGIGPFGWVIGDATYFNWGSAQPDNSNHHHAIMNVSDGQWYDRLGDEIHSVMCECDPKSPPRNY